MVVHSVFRQIGGMRRTKTLASLAAALVLALALGGYAYAHPALGFESDLSEDGMVNVCNPDNVRPGRVTAAINQWNALSAQWGTPALRQVTGDNAFCEVTVEERGGPQANFYARVVFGAHPDKLQISPRFREIPGAQRQATITHEFGHVLGLNHPPADVTLCTESVMTTITECSAVGVERRSTPGPHDEADLFDYWVEEPIYPVANKCWDNACSNSGPPESTFGASARDAGGGSGGRKVGAGDSSSGVQAPGAIKD